MGKGGHPTTYRQSYIKMVDEYLAQCNDEYKKIVKQCNEEKGYEIYDNLLSVNLPSMEGFSIYAKIPLRTLYSWRDKNPEFLHATEKIKILQKERLVSNGLAGVYNSTITRLLLSANHSMVERSEVAHKGLSELLDEADSEDE